MRELNRPIQLGILGCGSFIQRRILPILQELDTVTVVALQKRKLCEAQQIASKYNIACAVSSREELLSLPQVEAVLIATTNCLHEEDAIACAAHFLPTLCEKPLAPTALGIEKMIESFQSRSVPLFVGQSLRFKFCVQKAKHLLEAGSLGRFLSIRAQFSLPVPKENWRHQKKRGGGVLQDIGVHLIDLIRFISGQEIQSIFALANSNYEQSSPEAEQTVTAICRLTDGSVSSFECSFERPFSSGFEVIGTKAQLISQASLRQSNDSLEILYLKEGDEKFNFPIPESNIYIEELKHFADALRGMPTILSAVEGLENQKIIEAALRSIHEGQEIRLR